MYAQAEQAYRQALAILEKDPRQKVSMAHTLNNLAALYHDQGMDAKAEPLYMRALGIWKRLGRIRAPMKPSPCPAWPTFITPITRMPALNRSTCER